jgi:hypothetical protein
MVRRKYKTKLQSKRHTIKKPKLINQKAGYSPISSGFNTSLNPYPPGGPYVVGSSTNGLGGGYYYSYNQNPTLQTRIIGMEDNVGFLKATGQTLAPGVKDYSVLRGGRSQKGRKTRRKRDKKGTKKRQPKKMRRSKHKRTKRGGSGLKSLVPADVLAASRQTGYGVRSLYDGMTGQRFGVNPSVMEQPIGRHLK